MCPITSSSEMWPIGLNSATETVTRPAPKQSWRQTGTRRPSQERVNTRRQ